MTANGSDERRRLKILHIDPEMRWGGGESQVFGLLSFLAARGHQNELASHPDGTLFAKSESLCVRRHPVVIRNDLDLCWIPALRRKLWSENFDIVHFHTKRAHALSLWLPRRRHLTKFVVTRRMDYPESRSWYTRTLYNRRVDGVVAISQSIADLLIAAGVDGRRLRVIRSGIDPAAFAALQSSVARPNGEIMFGSVGVLEDRKGHRVALDAVAALRRQGYNVKYRIAGDGTRRHDLEQQAIQLGIKDQVGFFGFVADTVNFLADVDIFIMPSLFEGLGVAALEAMAAGRPVVATRVGGLAESVVDGVTGRLVPPNDTVALAAAMSELAQQPERAIEMGKMGRQRVMRDFTLEQMALWNEAFYYELLETPAN